MVFVLCEAMCSRRAHDVAASGTDAAASVARRAGVLKLSGVMSLKVKWAQTDRLRVRWRDAKPLESRTPEEGLVQMRTVKFHLLELNLCLSISYAYKQQVLT
jgi:hypothetical protein